MKDVAGPITSVDVHYEAGAAFGALVSSHSAARGSLWIIPLGIIIAAGGAAVALGPLLFPDPRLDAGGTAGVVVLGMLLVLLGVGASLAVWRNRSRRVFVCEHGIIEQRGQQRTELLWHDVSSLICERVQLNQAGGLVSQTIARFILRTDAGAKLVLDHLLADIDALGDEVERQVNRRQLPRARARIAAGESVAFAPLTVSVRGLARGTRELAWERMARVEVADGQVCIFARGEASAWTKVSYAKLSNALTLLELVSEHEKVPTRFWPEGV